MSPHISLKKAEFIVRNDHIGLSCCFMRMTEGQDIKYLVPVKLLEKPVKVTTEAKAELQKVGMMDEKGKPED